MSRQTCVIFILILKICIQTSIQSSQSKHSSDSGVFGLQISSETVATVPFGATQLSVWKDVEKDRFFMAPMGFLLSQTAKTVFDPLRERYQLLFYVQLWSIEAQEAVFLHLKANKMEVEKKNIQLIPMEKIRLYFPFDDVSDSFSIPTHWTPVSRLPETVNFQIDCKNKSVCNDLEKSMKTSPMSFSSFQVQFKMNAEETTIRRIEVTGRHMQSGQLYSHLESMVGAQGSDRYLTSDDIKRLSSESVNEAVANVRTDEGYVPHEDEIIDLSRSLEQVLKTNDESSKDFDERQWDSVFWNDDWSRPDKVTHALNDLFYVKQDESDVLHVNENAESSSKSVGVNLGIPNIEIGGNTEFADEKSETTTSNEINNILRESKTYVEWDGRKFTTKPMDLYRVNLNHFESSSTILSDSVQVHKVLFQHSIMMVVDHSLENKSNALNLNLLQQRLENEIKKLEEEMKGYNDVIESKSADVVEITRKNFSLVNEENKKLRVELQTNVNELRKNASWPPGSYCIFQQPKSRNAKNGYTAKVCPDGFNPIISHLPVDSSHVKTIRSDYNYEIPHLENWWSDSSELRASADKRASALVRLNHVALEYGSKGATYMVIRTCCKAVD